jgi:hypothetical protein
MVPDRSSPTQNIQISINRISILQFIDIVSFFFFFFFFLALYIAYAWLARPPFILCLQRLD